MKLIYLAHPMRKTAYDVYHSKIRRIALELVKKDFAVIIPTSYFDLIDLEDELKVKKWETLIVEKNDAELIRRSDIIFMSEGWELSSGCRKELEYAKLFEKEIMYG